MPEAVHASGRGGVRGKEVCLGGNYWEEEAIGNAMAGEGCNTGPWRGYALDEGENSLGQGQPEPEVVGGGEGGGQPVPQPSNHMGGVEAMAF